MISAFQRNIIKSELQKKLAKWNDPEQRRILTGNVTTHQVKNFRVFGIERDQDGYFMMSDDLIAYCNLRNGYVFRIRSLWEDQDWKCYSDLSKRGIDTGLFRVDIPLYKENMQTTKGVWEYAEVQSPGNDYGKNVNDDVFTWPELTNGITVNSSITEEFRNGVMEYFKEFVDQATVITHHARLVAEQNNCGMPKDLCYIYNRYKDINGYFWSDFDQQSWIYSREDIIEDALEQLHTVCVFAKICGVLHYPQVLEVFNYAREKWQTI